MSNKSGSSANHNVSLPFLPFYHSVYIYPAINYVPVHTFLCFVIVFMLTLTIAGGTLGVPVHVYGPETHMTAIVGMALEKVPVVKEPMTSSSLSLFNKHVQDRLLLEFIHNV